MPIEWRKSSRSNSGTGNCVELASLLGRIGVRDSKNPRGPAFSLPATNFREFVAAIKRGDHDML